LPTTSYQIKLLNKRDIVNIQQRNVVNSMNMPGSKMTKFVDTTVSVIEIIMLQMA